MITCTGFFWDAEDIGGDRTIGLPVGGTRLQYRPDQERRTPQKSVVDAGDPCNSYQCIAMIRLVNEKPEFRIVPSVHDEAVVGLGNPVQVLQFVVLSERQ